MTAPQSPELRRVTDRIATAVLEFCEPGRQFHITELVSFVALRVGIIAPDSAGRVLRLLRQAGKVNYRVIDRSGSLYLIERPVPTQSDFPGFLAPIEEYPG